ncbi:MAG: hypothetical protein Q8Q14_16330, partial [Gemmatimonadales bacterium]|nr:hypothetical protein [Gemmatimonadales bacterium]
ITKRDLVDYYIAVADGALRGAGGGGPAQHAGPVSERHRRGVFLSEAHAHLPPAVDRGRHAHVRTVARVVEAVLGDFGLVGWPKTSGKRGIHVSVRIRRASP